MGRSAKLDHSRAESSGDGVSRSRGPAHPRPSSGVGAGYWWSHHGWADEALLGIVAARHRPVWQVREAIRILAAYGSNQSPGMAMFTPNESASADHTEANKPSCESRRVHKK